MNAISLRASAHRRHRSRPVGVWRTAVTSTALRAIGYDIRRHILAIRFQNGRLYHYYDVPLHVYSALLGAGSHGQYFNTDIRGKYEYRQVA